MSFDGRYRPDYSIRGLSNNPRGRQQTSIKDTLDKIVSEFRIRNPYLEKEERGLYSRAGWLDRAGIQDLNSWNDVSAIKKAMQEYEGQLKPPGSGKEEESKVPKPAREFADQAATVEDQLALTIQKQIEQNQENQQLYMGMMNDLMARLMGANEAAGSWRVTTNGQTQTTPQATSPAGQYQPLSIQSTSSLRTRPVAAGASALTIG